MNIIKEKTFSVLRYFFGYKYKVVYTEIILSPTLKKRFMIKLPIDGAEIHILKNLPKYKDKRYMKPISLFYSKTDKYLYCRYELKNNDATGNIFRTFYK